VDLQERLRLDTSVAKVRAKARPWRWIFALILAIAGAVTAEVSGARGWGAALNQHCSSKPATGGTRTLAHLSGLVGADPASSCLSEAQRLAYICGAVAFLVFGLIAAVGLSGMVRKTSQPLIGQAHAGVLRYVLVLVGIFAVLTFSLAIAQIDVKQLLVSGAVAGVLLGIAAQQALANLFAGLVLLFARPFRVGDHVRLRAGALSGIIEGTVIDVSLTYVRLKTEDGLLLVPNSQALAAAVLHVPDELPAGPAGAAPPGVPASPPAGPGSTPR
jgi:small-conductance mechanosensitive channel